jgi:hypothetical protein
VQKALGNVIGRDFPGKFEITREYRDPETGLRPDFAISFNKKAKPILIEVKILDEDYHFIEYLGTKIDDQNPDKILMSAHKPKTEHSEWKITLWSEFIDELEEMKDEFSKALVIYLRRTTMSEKIEAIRFNSPMGMLYLNRAIEKTINTNQGSDFSCHIYANRAGFGRDFSGYYYRLKNKANGKEIAWPYFGIYYAEDAGKEYLGICISLLKEQNWRSINKKSYKNVAKALKRKYGSYFKEYETEDVIWMNDNSYNNFLKENRDNQLTILKKFFFKANSIIFNGVCGK